MTPRRNLVALVPTKIGDFQTARPMTGHGHEIRSTIRPSLGISSPVTSISTLPPYIAPATRIFATTRLTDITGYHCSHVSRWRQGRSRWKTRGRPPAALARRSHTQSRWPTSGGLSCAFCPHLIPLSHCVCVGGGGVRLADRQTCSHTTSQSQHPSSSAKNPKSSHTSSSASKSTTAPSTRQRAHETHRPPRAPTARSRSTSATA